MKNGKNPTVAQKKFLKGKGLNPENWLIVKNLHDRMEIIHRNSSRPRTIRKENS